MTIVTTKKEENKLLAFGILLLLTAGISVLMGFLLNRDVNKNTEKLTNSEKMSAHSDTVPNATSNMDQIVNIRSLAKNPTSMPTNVTRAQAYNNGPIGYNIAFNTHPQALNIETRSPANAGTQARAIEQATKGDGVLRTVYSGGQKVPKEMVDYAMFENHEFYNHSDFEFAVKETPNMFDVSQGIPQKSMFGPIKPIENLGLDWYTPTTRDTNSLRIAEKGGRF